MEHKKLNINEEYDYGVLCEIEEQLIDDFYNLTESEYLSYFDSSMETGGGAIWILPDGQTIELDLHQDFGTEIFYKFCKDYFKLHPEYSEDYSEDDIALEDAHEFNDMLVDSYNWIKYNMGTIYDDRCYVCIPKKITSKQYRVLENIIEESIDFNKQGDLLVLPQEINYNTYYDFTKYSARDIIKKIMNYCAKGILEEDLISSRDVYFTSSPYSARDYIINRPKAYRILYDKNIDLYMIGDANEFIHFYLITRAFDEGYYATAKDDPFIDDMVKEYITDRDIFNYTDIGVDGFYDGDTGIVEVGQYLLYGVWVPQGIDESELDYSPSNDGYDDAFWCPAGVLYTRDLGDDLLREVPLINLLSHAKQAVTESVSNTFLNKLTSAWNSDTCHPAFKSKYSDENPAAGQCLVTALAVQDEYGGDIYDCKVGRSRHFYNVVNGETIDLTFNQFPENSVIKEPRIRDRKQLLSNKDTRDRYELLKSRMNYTEGIINNMIKHKINITEDWDERDTEFIDYVLGIFESWLHTQTKDSLNRDDYDSMCSRFLARGLTLPMAQRVIDEMDTYLSYTGVEIFNKDIDLNHGSIWDYLDSYEKYLVVEQNMSSVLSDVAYEKGKQIFNNWKTGNKKLIELPNIKSKSVDSLTDTDLNDLESGKIEEIVTAAGKIIYKADASTYPFRPVFFLIRPSGYTSTFPAVSDKGGRDKIINYVNGVIDSMNSSKIKENLSLDNVRLYSDRLDDQREYCNYMLNHELNLGHKTGEFSTTDRSTYDMALNALKLRGDLKIKGRKNGNNNFVIEYERKVPEPVTAKEGLEPSSTEYAKGMKAAHDYRNGRYSPFKVSEIYLYNNQMNPSHYLISLFDTKYWTYPLKYPGYYSSEELVEIKGERKPKSPQDILNGNKIQRFDNLDAVMSYLMFAESNFIDDVQSCL